MYTVYVDDYLLHDPRLTPQFSGEGRMQTVRTLSAAILTESINAQGAFDFTVPKINASYDRLRLRHGIVRIFRDGQLRWRGRLMQINKGWDNARVCHAEGALAFLQDSTIPPFAYKGSPEAFLDWILTLHNGEMGDSVRRIGVGDVTVVDPNGVIVRSSETALSGWELLRTKGFESSLGGYFRYNIGSNTLDWLADFTDGLGNRIVSNQPVQFGRNLLDLAIEQNAVDVVTCLIPYGARVEETIPDVSSGTASTAAKSTWNGGRLTVESVNDGSLVLRHAAGREIWGDVFGSEIFDEITEAANLKTAGLAYLDEQYDRVRISLAVTAADLSLTDSQMDEITPGVYVPAVSAPHSVNELLLCTAKTTNIVNPASTTITLGVGSKPLSALIGGLK